jgi:HAD superfamily hydrolase (TIGR01662 family)
VTIRGIIFDLGWTLVDFASDIPGAEPQRIRDLDSFLLENGLGLDGAAVFASYREEMRALWQAGAALNYEYPARLAMLRALRRYLDREDATRFAAAALDVSFESVVSQWQLYPDTLDTLSALRDDGYRLGCISNTNDGAHVWRIVDRCELRPWLSPIYTSQEVGLRKPHPRIFEMVLEQWRLPPDQVIMVGDTLNADVLGAHNADMHGVWIDRGLVNPWSNNEKSKTHIVPDATIQQLAELLDLLDELGLLDFAG